MSKASRVGSAIGVKGGGRMSPAGFQFELTGGALCLDFVNTGDSRPTRERKELLHRYEDLLAWARQAGALSARHAAGLQREASRRPGEAQAVLDRARTVRETLFILFAAAAAGRALPAAELHSLDPAVTAALDRLRLAPAPGTGARWAWADGPELDRPLWPVLRSAADLLTSADLARVRECAAETCAWLFIDHSKNRSRRWCDMSVCGNRDKVRRHRQRRRAGRSPRATPEPACPVTPGSRRASIRARSRPARVGRASPGASSPPAGRGRGTSPRRRRA